MAQKITRLSSSLRLVFLLFVLPSLACALFSPPQGPIIPTPPNVAGSVATLPNLVTDPVGSIPPAVSPLVNDLINSVSTQNLLAYLQTITNFGTRHTLSDTQAGDFGIGAARRWIYDEFVRVGAGRLQVSYDDFRMPYQGILSEQRNIVATLPGIGTHPGVILFTAHYDSRTIDINNATSLAPGANDNGSGVAVLLEMARLLSPYEWNQTIMFVAFAAEEQSTQGSSHFVTSSLLQGLVMDVAINNDIVGGRVGIPQSLRLFVGSDPFSRTTQLGRYMDYVTTLYLPNFPLEIQPVLDREGRYSDHREFVRAGIAAVRFTESVEDQTVQHTGNDTPDLLDYNYLRQVVQTNLLLAANMAGAPPPPIAPFVTPMANPGAFIITWAADPTAAGYAISFRPIDSPDYPPFRLVNGNQAGNVALTGFDPNVTYAVAIAGISASGQLGIFSPEIIISP